jgi:predicted RNase H-like nuclease
VKLVGVDGCRAGWVVAACALSPGADRVLSVPTFRIEPTFRELLDRLEGHTALIAVDIPIGLPSGAPLDDGTRRCDAEARAFLGGRRRSSVFSAPCRPTLEAGSYREACDLEVRARGRGKGLSQETYWIVRKIREVDQVVRPDHQEPLGDEATLRVREAHPEVTFAMLAGSGQPGHGLLHSKRGCMTCPDPPCPGERDRLALLRAHLLGFEPRTVHRQLVRDCPRPEGLNGPMVGRDDVVDAAACLVTAYRIATGQARTLPAGRPQRDARGLRMEIVA